MSAREWDAIVVGSGIGGLACAAALARCGRRVLVLEQHWLAGGLTQSFSREGFTWDVGLHYLGDMGAAPSRALDWITDGAIELAPTGKAFDVVHFPDGFEFVFRSPRAALERDLKERFPSSAAEIDAFFAALAHAHAAALHVFRMRALPRAAARLYRWLKRPAIRKWVERTLGEVLRDTITDEKLRAVLSAHWPDHGGSPAKGSFMMHAVVLLHYLGGSRYPRGGAAAFARALVPVIQHSGGEVRLSCRVTSLLIEGSRTVGVRLADGGEIRADSVIAACGARRTVESLVGPALRESEWARDILSLELTGCHLGLYLGLEGDVRAGGASDANHWFYESWDTEAATWRPGAQERPPLMFVSFPSLKDPAHRPGSGRKHTAEAIAWAAWDDFAPWAGSRFGARPPDYERLKALAGERLLAQFKRRFPGLAPLVRCTEVSTPLTLAAFTGAPRGAVYSLAPTPRRFLSTSLATRTPLPGLYLAGQDATSPGVPGAMMGGLLAAASIEPTLFRRLA
jgi:phytoene dehydrogenase-like protein